MSILEDPSRSSSGRDIDPLFSGLNEKEQSFRRNVVSLAAELKAVQSRLASREQSFARETLIRQEAEAKAKNMGEVICRLQKSLEESNNQLQASPSTAEKYLKEMRDLRSQLTATQTNAKASAASAQYAQFQCLALSEELDEKNRSLKECEACVNRLEGQLLRLQKDLQARESSQKQLNDEVLRIKHDIMLAVAKAGATKDCEMKKMLNEISAKSFEKFKKLLIVKDEEIALLRDEIRIVSGHWDLKTKELESELEKHQRANLEIKKKVTRLEFCLQEARAHTRKLQRMGERQDKALKELRHELEKKQQGGNAGIENHNFWESAGFKIIVSMSMLVLVLFSKR